MLIHWPSTILLLMSRYRRRSRLILEKTSGPSFSISSWDTSWFLVIISPSASLDGHMARSKRQKGPKAGSKPSSLVRYAALLLSAPTTRCPFSLSTPETVSANQRSIIESRSRARSHPQKSISIDHVDPRTRSLGIKEDFSTKVSHAVHVLHHVIFHPAFNKHCFQT